MPKKYDVIDELIKDELREFLLWIAYEKKLEICKEEMDDFFGIYSWFPIHKAPEDLINEYMEIE